MGIKKTKISFSGSNRVKELNITKFDSKYSAFSHIGDTNANPTTFVTIRTFVLKDNSGKPIAKQITDRTSVINLLKQSGIKYKMRTMAGKTYIEIQQFDKPQVNRLLKSKKL